MVGQVLVSMGQLVTFGMVEFFLRVLEAGGSGCGPTRDGPPYPCLAMRLEQQTLLNSHSISYKYFNSIK